MRTSSILQASALPTALAWTVASLTVVAAPLAAQTQGQTCIGRTCGRDRGFPIEHCHTRPGGDPNGSQICWSSLFDFACEEMGFTVNIACPGSGGTGIGGALAGQAPRAASGYNLFKSRIARGAAPAIAEVAADDGGTYHFTEILAAAELETWTFAGVDGETPGLSFGWNRRSESGFLFSLAGSYQEADPDLGDKTELINLGASFGHTIGEVWSWTADLNFSDLSGLDDVQLFGGGATISFANAFENGHVFSGGLIGQFNTSSGDFFDEDVTTIGAGLAYGFPLGRRLTWDFDAFAVHVLDPDLADDTFFLVGTQLGIYFTPSFGLHLGYRILEGIDDLDSDTITLGFAGRWE